MTRTTFAQLDDKAAAASTWYVVDAGEHVLGRLASRIAEVLMGKHKPNYTPHLLVGEGVVVVNAEKLRTTGTKADNRVYLRYSGYPGGLKQVPFARKADRDPGWIIKTAVRRMLPKSRLGRTMLSRLKVYRGATHPHLAQSPTPLPFPDIQAVPAHKASGRS
jgi:large subunit ribosomal protein L13